MNLLSEDELMNIMQYVPDISLGVSDERLYHEIKLLDPTFDLYRFYYRLYDWAIKYSTIKNHMYMPLYNLLNTRDKYIISRSLDGNNAIYTDNMEVMVDDINALNMNRTMVLDQSFGNKYIRYFDSADDIRTSLIHINEVMVSHPLISPMYYGEYIQFDDFVVPWYRFRHYSTLPVLSSSYDDTILDAIKELDPSINMTTIYKHVVDRAGRLKNSDRYRSILGPLVNHINAIQGEDNDSITIFWKGSNHTDIDDRIYEAFPTKYGWVHDTEDGYMHSKYNGSDYMDMMYDLVLMDRSHAMFPSPDSMVSKVLLMQ